MFSTFLFSRLVRELPKSKKIAYIAVVTAITVIANTFFELKFLGVQFSLTIFVSVVAGMILGALPAFCACFLGDLFGFMLHPMGEYSPFIGIATGLMAVFGALIIALPFAFKGGLFLKIGIACALIFVVCTAGITTVYLNLVWYKSMTYGECLFTRLFVEGQIWNSVFNYALLFALTPVLAKIQPLGIKIE